MARGGQARNCENSIRIQSSAILQSLLVFHAMPEMTKPEKEISAFEPIAAFLCRNGAILRRNFTKNLTFFAICSIIELLLQIICEVRPCGSMKF